jgi:xanthine dehydrogenase accessory factor
LREVLPELMAWWHAGHPVGMGTVVATWDSAPRQPGASMLVGPQSVAVGSVSGGCVESDVYALAEEVLEHKRSVLQHYGVSDEDALSVGLTCGGMLDVFVEEISPETFPELGRVFDDVTAGRPVAIATVIEHPDPAWVGRRIVVRPEETSAADGSLGSDRADAAVVDDVRGLLAVGASELLTYGPDGQRRGVGMRVFAASFTPAPRMLIFGAIDFAAAVARLGGFLGYTVTVCDARAVFATASRFPDADEIVVEWPHRYLAAEAAAGRIDGRTAICVLTHDPKFDLPLLEVALRLPDVAYIGAMGSRRTSEERRRQLSEAGLSPAQLQRLSSPIGLDLGARTPEETAISIVAEIVSLRWGGQGRRLVDLDGRIHHDAGTSPASSSPSPNSPSPNSSAPGSRSPDRRVPHVSSATRA